MNINTSIVYVQTKLDVTVNDTPYSATHHMDYNTGHGKWEVTDDKDNKIEVSLRETIIKRCEQNI